MAVDKLINQTQGDEIIDKLGDIADKIHDVNYGLETTSEGIVQMAGYQKSSEATPGDISQGDTLNQAIGKLEKRIDNDETALAGKAAASHTHGTADITDFPSSMPASDVSEWAKASEKPTYTASEVGAVPTSRTINSKALSSDVTLTASDVGAIATTAKGAASGVAELDANGKVPTAQLPSYVDDVLEYSAKSSFPAQGETGKIYVDTSDNRTYRWGGTAYVEISASLALGETSSTAYYGDKGKTAYEHSQVTSGNPHNVKYSDLSDAPTLGTAAAKDVPASGNASASQVVMGNDSRLSDARTPTSHTHTKSQITDFPASMPASDVYSWAKASSKPSYTASEVGAYAKPSGGIPKTDLASAVQTSLGLADTSLQHSTVTGSPDLNTYLTTGVYHIATQTATHAPTTNHATLFVDATVGTPYQIFKPDANDTVWYTRHRSGSAWTDWVAMKLTDTTYSDATTSAAGLMSAADKTKLNGIATGAQVNSITGVKGNAESTYRTGNVNLTAANVRAVDSSGITTVNEIQINPTGGSYNEGLRIGKASNGWSNINLGCSNTTTTGNVAGQWLIGARGAVGSKSGAAGDFTIEHNGSSGTGLTLYANGNTPTWNGAAFSMSGHTHTYAGSSSAGGAATSAQKLNTNAGSATQPVYFSNGVPVATTYSLGKSVPSDAKFTDTTYSVATTSANGLMSSSDKTVVNSLSKQTFTSVTVNGATSCTGGYIRFGKLCLLQLWFKKNASTGSISITDLPAPSSEAYVMGSIYDMIDNYSVVGAFKLVTNRAASSILEPNKSYAINLIYMAQ